MPYGYKCECENCSFKTNEIYLDGWEKIFICVTCKEVITADIKPFKYDVANCPTCKSTLFLSDRLNQNGKSLCPNCGETDLKVTERSHYLIEKEKMRSVENSIKEGQLVHGKYLGLSFKKNSGLLQLTYGGKARIIEGYSDLDVGSHIECQVVDVKDNIYFCKVKFIRILKFEDY